MFVFFVEPSDDRCRVRVRNCRRLCRMQEPKLRVCLCLLSPSDLTRARVYRCEESSLEVDADNEVRGKIVDDCEGPFYLSVVFR